MNVSSSAVEAILSRLRKVRATSAHQWTALCPAHDDHTPSLSIGVGDAGVLLLNCFARAGCTYESILRAIRLTPREIAALGDTTAPRARGGNALERRM
jgi:hypothetical protein